MVGYWPNSGLRERGTISSRDNIISNAAWGSSSTWPEQYRIIYCPFVVQELCVATDMWVTNGGAVSGNLMMGIYDRVGTKLGATASTAQSGTSSTQIVSLSANVSLTPGQYYMALAFDGTTATTRANTGLVVVEQKVYGLAQETPGSLSMPDNATFVTHASAYWPSFGIRTVTP